MNRMDTFMNFNLFWAGLACAVLLFWAIGARSRLARLRKQLEKNFAALDALMTRELAWMQSCLPADVPGSGASAVLHDESQTALLRLWAACEQLAAALAQTRQDPGAAAAIEGLAAAHQTLNAAWQRAVPALAGPEPDTTPAQLDERRTRLLHQSLPLREAFNAAVLTYNRALAQFPVNWLARASGLRAAATLQALQLPA